MSGAFLREQARIVRTWAIPVWEVYYRGHHVGGFYRQPSGVYAVCRRYRHSVAPERLTAASLDRMMFMVRANVPRMMDERMAAGWEHRYPHPTGYATWAEWAYRQYYPT